MFINSSLSVRKNTIWKQKLQNTKQKIDRDYSMLHFDEWKARDYSMLKYVTTKTSAHKRGEEKGTKNRCAPGAHQKIEWKPHEKVLVFLRISILHITREMLLAVAPRMFEISLKSLMELSEKARLTRTTDARVCHQLAPVSYTHLTLPTKRIV